MYLFKRELFVTSSLNQRSKILDLLSNNKIKYYLKTEDNFGGGMYAQRRLTGSFGMDESVRFNYYIYVSRKNYSVAIALLEQNHIL